MGNCRDCKYWELSYVAQKYQKDPEFKDWRECVRASDAEAHNLSEQEQAHLRKMFALCWSEGITAELMTRGDFGCVEFELVGLKAAR